MKALNNDAWYDRDTMQREDELRHNRIAEADQTPDGDLDNDDEPDTDIDDDDDVLETDYDNDVDDDLLDDDDEEQEDASAINSDFVNDADPDNMPEKQEGENEIPEQGESDNEKLEYPHETEVEQQDKGNDASYSEQNDVTPPRTHEFPSEGNAKTDFASRNHGRSTGRMLGHEPGTEGI